MEEEVKVNIEELRKKIEQNSSTLKKINEEKELKYKEKNKLDRLLFSFIKKANEIRDEKKKTDKDIRTLKKSREGLNTELKNLFSKFRNIKRPRRGPAGPGPDQIKKQIEAIQFTIETEALKFEREKAYMDKINELKVKLKAFDKVKTDVKDSRSFKKVIFQKKKVADETHEKIIDLATQSSKDFEKLTELSQKISRIKGQKSELQSSLKDYKQKIDDLNQKLEVCLQEWSEISTEDMPIKKQTVDIITKLKDKKTLTKDDILELQRKSFRKRR